MTDRHVHHRQRLQSPFGTIVFSVSLPPMGETFEHQLDGFCWCQPLVEDDLVDGRVYIHRRSVDSPHIESKEWTA